MSRFLDVSHRDEEHALYEALSTLENSNTRYHYLAPAYELYASLFRCSDDVEAASYDPRQNASLRAFFIQCAAYANDPASVGLDLLGGDTVRLFVSDEYMHFAGDNAITCYVDLLWLKNAFCTDYIASVLRENGYTRGTVISYDGFICHLGDAPETQFDYTFSHRQDNVIAAWKTLSFSHPASIVYLHDYPFGYEDEDNYYVYGSGETVFPFVDVSDGMTASLPVIECAKELGADRNRLYRALAVSDLVTIHQKTSIGRLSAFCGAVSAGCGAAAGIAYLNGNGFDVIAHTIVNTLAILSGMVGDTCYGDHSFAEYIKNSFRK